MKLTKKLWSISTTLRNPERVRNFLIALQNFEGKIWNQETQISFQVNLIKLKFYGYGNSQFENTLSEKHKEIFNDINHHLTFEEAKEIFDSKNYEDPAMRGRTSFKPLQKMGVAFIKDGKVFISSLGKYLLSDSYDLGELFFKSFLKWQYPNPLDRDFSNSEIYNIKPFIVTLHLIKKVNEICQNRNLKQKGISKLEFEIFGQSLIHYKNIEKTASRILDFRTSYESKKNHKEKQDFIQKTKESFLYEFSNATDGNIKDYADNTIRYFRLTRFIYIRGGGYYIDLEPRRKIEIDKLLETYSGEAESFTKEEYIDFVSDINLPVLPWETDIERKKILENTKSEILELEKELGISQSLENLNIQELQTYRKQLQDLIIKQKYQDISKVDEVINSLQNIRKLELKPSIALEKYTTLALNIINDAISINANSLVGDDNEFIFTAPANKPDIECYYESFNSICEVTMLTGRDQWYNEGQPVMRHFRDFENSSEKENYCLFIAPKLHRDTINTFWFSVKYEYEGKQQKIVPLTINQLIEILEFIKILKSQNRKLLHFEFQKLLEDILNLKDFVSSSEEWLKAIPKTLDNFKKSFYE
jgi:hypothetical protein